MLYLARPKSQYGCFAKIASEHRDGVELCQATKCRKPGATMISLIRWLKELGEGGGKLFFLMALDGFVVSLARRWFIERGHFSSLGDFATAWFVHFCAVGLFAVFAGASLMSGRSRKFWLGGAAERDWSTEEALYAVLMTVLVAAIFSVFVASAGSYLDDVGDYP
jgi:hypothetical protein